MRRPLSRRALYQIRLNWLDGSTTFSRVFHTLAEVRTAMRSFAEVSLVYSVELEAL
jgi:hypothetical protein